MKFEEALENLRKGHVLTRKSWENALSIVLYLSEESMSLRYLENGNFCETVLLSSDNLLSTDWEIVE